MRNPVTLRAILHLLEVTADLAGAVAELQESGGERGSSGGGRADSAERRAARSRQLSVFGMHNQHTAAGLQRAAEEGVAKLLAQLDKHHTELSTHGSAVGDSSRELASLHNLMERLKLGAAGGAA